MEKTAENLDFLMGRRRLYTIFCMALACAFLITFNGCVKLGPDFHRPASSIQVPKAFQHSPPESASLGLEDRWWEAFGDPELDQLVEEIIKNNLDIRKAAARIMELRSKFIQSRADSLPDLSLRGNAQRSERTTSISTGFSGSTTRFEKTTTDSFGLSMPASFELDLWGRLARNEEAALADLLQAEENRRSIAQTAVADAVSLYLQIESIERRIQIAEKSIGIYRRSLELTERRYNRGLTTILDIRQARRTLLSTEAKIPTLRQDLGIKQHMLAILLGHYPKTNAPRTHPEDYFKRLAPVPPGLPSELLTRRPDIRAAEASLKALNARVGVAHASRFPSISLTGSFGYSSSELRDIFDPASELWNIALGITQPLFNGNKLRAAQRSAELRYEQGVIDYSKTVLRAFSEVEGALLTRQEQLTRRDRILDYLNEARAAQEVAESRYQKGLTSYLNVLVSQQARYTAEESLVQVDLAILNNRVTLHRSLGGGWAGAFSDNTARNGNL